MENMNKVSLLFNFIFIIALVLAVLYIVFNFTQGLYVGLFDDEKLVTDESVINELSESVTKYYDYLYYGQYEKAKHATAILSRKSNVDYENIRNEILTYGEYDVIIKYAYKLYANTYRCYVITYDKQNEQDLSFIMNKDKSKMNKIVISLDRFNDNFTIVSDEYFNI